MKVFKSFLLSLVLTALTGCNLSGFETEAELPSVTPAENNISDLKTMVPPQSGSCPAVPPGSLSVSFVGPGNPIRQIQASGQITVIPVPAVTGNSVQISVGESPSVGSPQPVNIQATVSKCPGYIYVDSTDFCTLENSNGNYNSMTLITKPVSIFTNKETANRNGLCWAPESEGQWYFNIRWYYNLCGLGLATCGFAIQYNGGGY